LKKKIILVLLLIFIALVGTIVGANTKEKGKSDVSIVNSEQKVIYNPQYNV
jgi:hypothetical protein